VVFFSEKPSQLHRWRDLITD